ncbi:MAG: electron transfer flavoprotein-ubiquinone oxidoreductase [Pseudomonadota bacterium]
MAENGSANGAANGVARDDREAMDVDVVIVGAGPAGISAAIRLQQLAQENDEELMIVVLEKASEVGAHILSGAVIDPVGIDALIPDWKEKGAPITTEVTDDRFLVLGPAADLRLPNFLMPPLMSNHGNYIVSLGEVTKWLGEQAEAMGVEVYAGIAASEVLYEGGKVVGVATGDLGITRDGEQGPGFTPGMELRAKYTLFAEGVRGSLSKEVIRTFDLAKDSDPQKYGIGIKELWEVKPEHHKPGLVQHSFGWPLDAKTGGGSFLYHYGENLVSVGFVVHLNYENPYLSPYEEFQRFKTHEAIRDVFEGGKRIAYGARAITEGGFQSIPKLAFPGGALLGCSAGFVNVARIKGSHNAILSGKMAAEAAFDALKEGRQHDVLAAYPDALMKSDVAKDLKKVRNVKPLWTKFGTLLGVPLGALDMWLNTIIPGGLFTMRHKKADHEALKPAADCKPIVYPKADGKLTFDRLTNVAFSGTNHEEDQPIHLKVQDDRLQKISEYEIFDGPSNRYCPAGVYEWIADDENGGVKFQINSQNCVHCKTCDIKDPNQNINWTVPQGGEGPVYPGM